MKNLFLFTVALHATSGQFKLKDRRFSLPIPCSSQAGQSSIQCVGICASITKSFCQQLGNSSMLDVYPLEYKRCAGFTGFVGADKAPDSYCSLGYSRASHNPFTSFNQFVLEPIMLHRWKTTSWESPMPLVVLPSPEICSMEDPLDNREVWKPSQKATTRFKIKNYWNEVYRRFSSLKFPPLIVIHSSFAWDAFNVRLLEGLAQYDKAFVQRIVIGSIDGDNVPKTTRLALEGKMPHLITLPYPVGMANASSFFSNTSTPGYRPPDRRPIAVLFTGRFHNARVQQPVREALKHMLAEANNLSMTAFKFHAERHKLGYICAPGARASRSTQIDRFPDDLCGVHKLSREAVLPQLRADPSRNHSRERTKQHDGKVNPYLLATSADFCLEPSGDTPTRSHLYLALLSGCIPVIFDYERGNTSNGDFQQSEVGWAWRHILPSRLRLNYSEFAVVVDARQIDKHKLLQDLVAMPTTDPARFQSLRRGVDKAAKHMWYGMDDCGDRAECDAFGIFKEAVLARAAVLLSNSSTKIVIKRRNLKRKKREIYKCSKQ